MSKKKSDKRNFTFSRRSFAKGVTAGIGLGVSGISASQGTQQPLLEDEYDFIIVGSGAGGGPLAANLAKAGFSVLVLEAGSRDMDSIKREVPIFHGQASEDQNLSWAYYTNHYQDEDLQAQERKHYQDGEARWSAKGGVFYPRGSTIGGSTAVNAMITVLPHLEDFDYIAEITNDPSWKSLDLNPNSEHYPGSVFKYLEKVESWLPMKLSDIEILADGPDLTKILLSAVISQGFESVIDNAGNIFDPDGVLNPNTYRTIKHKKEGIFQVPMCIGNNKDFDNGVTVKPGQRGGVRHLLLETEAAYPNLTIQTDAFVSKLLFSEDSTTPEVSGVEIMIGEKLYKAEREYKTGVDASNYPKIKVKARHEVILAAGAFNTPQILKLSGIGPRAELEKFGIDVQVDLPGVGTNLQDRYEVPVISQLKRELPIRSECTFGAEGDPCLAEYYENGGEGTIYGSSGASLAIIKRSQEAIDNDLSPDLFMFGLPGYFDGYTEYYSDQITNLGDTFTWLVLKGHTNNTAGEVTLRSTDPLERPEINFNYYVEGNDASGADLEGVLEGVKVCREAMVNAQDLVAFESMPGSDVQSDDDLKDFIVKESWGHHASCSCAIGADDDPMAVLDSKFRVRGVENLRVVDASVFPKIPGFFIALPIYMVSEKASEDIINEYSS